MWQAVAPAIATLTALQALHLGSMVDIEALPYLKDALASLSALQDLRLHISSLRPMTVADAR